MNDLNIRIMKRYVTIVMVLLAGVALAVNLVVSYIAIRNSFNMYVNNSLAELEIYSSEVNQKISSGRKLATQIFSDPVIEDAVLLQGIDTDAIEERLVFYKSNDYYIESIYVYNGNSDEWYITSTDLATSQYWTNVHIDSLINNEISTKTVILNEKDGVPVYSVVISPYINKQSYVVINYYTNYFNRYNTQNDGEYIVMDNDGEVIINSGSFDEENDKDIFDLLLKCKDTKSNIMFQKGYAVVRSKHNDMIYFSVSNYSEFIGKVTPTMLSSLIGSLIMVLLLGFSFTNATTWILQKFGQYYWYAESAKNEIAEKSNIAELKAYLRGEGGGNINKVVSNIDKRKSCVLFRLYIRELEKRNLNESAEEKKALNYAVRNVLLELMEDISADVLKMNSEDIVVLCNAEDAETVYAKITKTKAVIEDVLSMKMAIIKHSNSIDFSHVPAMYERLLSAGERSFYVGIDTVIDVADYDDGTTVDAGVLIEKIERAVALGNAMEARDVLRTEDIMYMSVYDAKGLVGTLLNKLYARSRVLSEQKRKTIESMVNEINEHISGDCDWDSIVERLGTLFETIVTLSKHNAEEYTKEKYDQIIQIIHEHYCDDGFCRDILAEHTKMSIKSMEQIFKRRENKSITSYIFEYRMARAKQLLDDTELSVKEIAEKVGYFNVSHFIQNFKKTYFITPDKYRKNR